VYSLRLFFSTGTKQNGGGRASVFVRLNEKMIGEALSSDNTIYGGFSFQFLRKLVMGDKIYLTLNNGSTQIYLLYFTGWMLEQNIRAP